jgi:hypothetical protein
LALSIVTGPAYDLRIAGSGVLLVEDEDAKIPPFAPPAVEVVVACARSLL